MLPKKDRNKLVLVTLLQISLAFLDLLGVLAIGLLGVISVDNLQSHSQDKKMAGVLSFLHMNHLSFPMQTTLVGTFAVFTLIGRTLLSIYFTRRILYFLSRRGAKISTDLISRLLSKPLLSIQEKTTQEMLFSVTTGVSIIALSVLATSVVLISDLALLLIMGIGLIFVNLQTAIGIFFLFFAIGLLLYRMLHVRAGLLGIESSELNIRSNEKILEIFGSYREAIVRNRRDYYSREIGKLRYELAGSLAEINFMPYISKYIIESAVIFGALLIGAIQIVLQDASHAVSTLAIFLAAGTRIAPAILRVQQATIQIRTSLGQASPTLDLIDTLGDSLLVEDLNDSVELIHEGFDSSVHVRKVTLTYPGKSKPAISEISLEIPQGMSVALVGPSGAGKTTLIDVLLGVLLPDMGTVRVSGLPPLLAVAKWPGAVSYVPQDVVIVAGSIRENIALGYPIKEATEERVLNALKIANLEELVRGLQEGADTQVGEGGAKISGGQRQRLGIARAMFTKPHLLVLDEATSSLDAETELSISKAIYALRGVTTVIMIAHRLSTVKSADMVVYMADGKILATGTFDQVRLLVPDFDRQAKLMGL